MDEEKIKSIGKALRTDDHRLETLELIEKIDPLPRSLATAWINDIVYAIESENGAYNQLQIFKLLRRVARQYPDVAEAAVTPVVAEVNEDLQRLSGGNPSDSMKVKWGTEILWNIIEGTTTSESQLEICPEDVAAIVDRGDAEHRSLGYRLLGRSAGPEAIGKLTEDISYEVDSVLESRDTALEEAITPVLDSLDGEGHLSTADALISFSELYSSGVVNPSSQTVERSQRLLFEQLLSDRVDCERVLEAIGRLAKQDRAFADSAVKEAFELLNEGSDKRSLGWDVLSTLAKCAPPAVVSRADELAGEIEADESSGTPDALEIVSYLGKHGSTINANLARATVRALDRENRDVVLAAVRAVSAIGFHPPPNQLVGLADSNSRVGKAASKALDELSKREREQTPSFVKELRVGEAQISLFEDEAGKIHLKRRTKDGLWDDQDPSEVRRGTVEDTIEAVSRAENVPVVFPYFEPSEVVLLMLALVLNEPEADRQIGVYSPGSRTHWGMKGEIREELEQFALSDVAGEVVNAEPVPDVVPHAYVWDTEVKDDSRGAGPGRFVLCKKLHELRHVENLDIVLLNLTSRTRENVQSRLRAVEEEHPEATFVSAYSYYVKNERDGRPRYGPPLGLDSTTTVPGLETIDAVLGDDSPKYRSHRLGAVSGEYTTSNGPEDVSPQEDWSFGDDDVRSLADAASIRIDHVQAGKVSSLLDQVFEESASLRGVDDGGAGGMIFSRQLFFERLPVPGKDFDEWIRERYYEGDRFVPPLIEERIEDVKRRAGSVENLQAVRPLNRSVRIFQKVARELRNQNPLFDELKEYVRDARQNNQRLAIFSESPKHADILEHTLLKRDVVDRNELDAGSISVVSPDEARGMGVYDTLLVFGALHRENAAFYVHPKVAETVVLTYDRTWATMVERHARGFVDRLNGVVGGPDYSPYAYPKLSGDTEPERGDERTDVEPTESTAVADSESRDEGTSSLDPMNSVDHESKSKAEIIADAMESVSGREYREESGRYERALRNYTLQTESGEVIEVTNHDRILRRRKIDQKVEYHWVGPEALTSGDTVVTIPDELEEELWREQLRNLYENEISADQAVDRLGTWYGALQEIWRRVESELSADGVIKNQKVHGTIFDMVKESNKDFTRTRATLQTWFKSVLEADGPIDLVEDPSLTIGPRSYSDIEAIGRAFEYDQLVSGAKEIEAAMEGLRTINRQQGHELHETIREQMNASKSTRVSEEAEHHVVSEIEETGDESGDG